MKKYLKMLIIGLVFFGTSTVSYAQSEEELQIQYLELLTQLVQLLQGQQSMVNELVLPAGEVCGLRFNGDSLIISIQQELKNQGYTITKVDGKIGPETRAAVSAFQASAGAVKIDGLIGDETRRLLSQNSVACVGDVGVTLGSAETTAIAGVCSFTYQGANDITTIQQELKNQGYTITKIDGKIGPETRAAVSAFQAAIGAAKVDGLIGDETRIALSRTSLTCSGVNLDNEIQVTTTTVDPTLPPVVVPEPVEEPEPTTTTEPSNNTVTLLSDQITAAARSTSTGIPDDTAVFTYVVRFNHTGDVYVPTIAGKAFGIDVYQPSGGSVTTEGISSVVSSAQKIIRDDGTSYFRIRNGDTMSLRFSVQPGAGNYYAELGRLSYTIENAFTVVTPSMINYPFTSSQWRSETVNLLN